MRRHDTWLESWEFKKFWDFGTVLNSPLVNARCMYDFVTFLATYLQLFSSTRQPLDNTPNHVTWPWCIGARHVERYSDWYRFEGT